MIIRNCVAVTEIKPGQWVKESGDNKVGTEIEGEFIGVYGFENGKITKNPGDNIGVVINGGPVKVLVDTNVKFGGKAIMGNNGAFSQMPNDSGVYFVVGMFLEDGQAGDYVEMLVEKYQMYVDSINK